MRINHTEFIFFWKCESNYLIIKENFGNIFRNKIVTEGWRKEIELEKKATLVRYL